jgi:hypothetical protein
MFFGDFGLLSAIAELDRARLEINQDRKNGTVPIGKQLFPMLR